MKIGYSGVCCSGKSSIVMKYIQDNPQTGMLKDIDRLGYVNYNNMSDPLEHLKSFMIHINYEIRLGQNFNDIVTDRTAFDFLYDLNVSVNKKHPQYLIVHNMIENWIKSYDKIILLKPLPYINDGVRYSEELREKFIKEINIIKSKYKNIIEED